MRQFIICLGLSVLFHLLSSLLGGSFDPTEWTRETEGQRLGFIFYVFIMFCIWIVPMAFNYLNSEQNFKNK